MSTIIKAISTYLPKATLSNEELVADKRVPFDAEGILRKTGIASRHIAMESESTGDMAVQACEKLFASGAAARDQIDWLIVCTQTPDYLIPTTACILQDRLRLSRRTACLDINLACTGFVYSLVLADGLIASGHAQTVLLVNGDTYAKFIRRDDENANTIFGDAATATLLCKGVPSEGILGHLLETDGSGYDKLIRRHGGSKFPRGAGLQDGDYITMDGAAIFRFVQQQVPDNVKRLLSSRQLGLNDVDFFFLHQASQYMLETLARRMGIPQDRMPIHLRETGNTVSASIPLAIAISSSQNPGALPGKLALLSGFGAGLSYGSILYRFPAEELISFL